jgi:thiaminase
MNNITNHDSPYLAVSYLRRAEIHDRLGENAQAAEHYTEFIDLWSDCDPELRPMVEEARRALERLAESRSLPD